MVDVRGRFDRVVGGKLTENGVSCVEFDGESEFEVVECCADGAEAIAVARSGRVDVLVLDIRMRGMSGIDILRVLSAGRVTCSIVLLTAALSETDAVEGLRLGARGIVLKESSPDSLLECLRRVARGEQWIDSESMSSVIHAVPRRLSTGGAPSTPLTAREFEIVKLVAQGLRNKMIAERMSISEGTVKIHLHHIYEKLGLDGRLKLMLHAQKHGLV